ncbi:MAG: TRAP transporter substrate-binding protein [Rubrivivax sp.]|nr:TRAP transporter substrate-binding protein [Rubrivivax sp.]
MLNPSLARWLGACAAGLLCVLSTAAFGQAAAGQTEHLRVVGGLAGVNQFVRHEQPFWAQEIPRLTQGRITVEIVPFDQAGLSGDEMLRVMQMGAVPFGTLLLGRSASVEPELAGPDLAGLNPDHATLERTVAAYRPRMARLLRERYGIELLAIYTYPAQVVFCAKPFGALTELAGRRVRVSSISQADFFSALGATPLQTPFAQIVPGIRAGTLDCAVTGTMSGNTIGLHEVTTHVHAMAINWGLAAFVANGERWAALQPAVRQVISRELPRLERNIWAESERETAEGLACNSGDAACRGGRKGAMKVVATRPADEALRQDLLSRVVVPAWLKRCGESCAAVWQQSLARGAAPTR